jgi:transposase
MPIPSTLVALENESAHAHSAPAVAEMENLNRTQEIPGPLPGRRRRFTNEEKRQFIAEAMAAGESMSSVGRRHGLSVSLLFRWRRQLDRASAGKASAPAARSETTELRERVRELERLLGRKTLEVELLQQELARLGQNPAAALLALDNAPAPAEARR